MEGTLMAIARSSDHDWSAAAAVVMPVLQPIGAAGLDAGGLDRAGLFLSRGAATGLTLHWPGILGIPIAVAIPGDGYDALVNLEHLVSWDVEPKEVLSTALANLATWSNSTPWDEEVSGPRRLMVSDSGERWDAARILLLDVCVLLERELGKGARVLVGIPSRHLLVAGALAADDPAFADDFRAFVAAEAEGADEPIDARVFELIGGALTDLAGV
jgi:hypothetical protein